MSIIHELVDEHEARYGEVPDKIILGETAVKKLMLQIDAPLTKAYPNRIIGIPVVITQSNPNAIRIKSRHTSPYIN